MSLKSKQVLGYSLVANQKGSTLIEVLVAFFLLAVGLLGVVGMQASAMRSGQSAEMGTQANMLARDMIDRIRAYDDPNVATDDNFYDGLDTGPSGKAYSDPGCVTATGGCTGALLKQSDGYYWGQQLASSLPAGRGTVVWDTARSVLIVTVYWDADRTGASGTGCSDDTSVDLTCFVTELQL